MDSINVVSDEKLQVKLGCLHSPGYLKLLLYVNQSKINLTRTMLLIVKIILTIILKFTYIQQIYKQN
jgi:hypothetical protein